MTSADAQAAAARPPLLRLLTGAALLLLACTGGVIAHLWPVEMAALMHRATSAERALGVAGWAVAFAAQTLIALCGLLPASAGAIAAGLAFGVGGGFCISAGATFIGALLAFLLARSLFRPMIARSLSRRPRFAQLDDAITRDGWRLVALMRLSPIMPFAATSYAMGLTSLSMRAYLIGTLASMPALLGYVVMGSVAGAGLSSLTTSQARPWHWAVLALALIVTTGLTLRLAKIVGSVLRMPMPSQAAHSRTAAAPK